MAKKAYAKRYSQAAFQIAVERNELDKWQSDLKKAAELGEDAKYMALLEDSRLSSDDRISVLSERLGDIHPMVQNLILLLISRGRLSIIAGVASEFQRLVDNSRGIEQAEVVTAVQMDKEEEKKVAQRLSEIVGKEVVITVQVDPDIQGGIIARIGGKLLDGSTRGRLEALKHELGRAAK